MVRPLPLKRPVRVHTARAGRVARRMERGLRITVIANVVERSAPLTAGGRRSADGPGRHPVDGGRADSAAGDSTGSCDGRRLHLAGPVARCSVGTHAVVDYRDRLVMDAGFERGMRGDVARAARSAGGVRQRTLPGGGARAHDRSRQGVDVRRACVLDDAAVSRSLVDPTATRGAIGGSMTRVCAAEGVIARVQSARVSSTAACEAEQASAGVEGIRFQVPETLMTVAPPGCRSGKPKVTLPAVQVTPVRACPGGTPACRVVSMAAAAPVGTCSSAAGAPPSFLPIVTASMFEQATASQPPPSGASLYIAPFQPW